jgi:GTP-binding protein
VPADELDARCRDIVRRLRFKGPVFRISGATGQGTRELCEAVMQHLDSAKATTATAAD